MSNLVLIRHGQSEWNQKNQFTGWMDIDLNEKGKEEARQAGLLLKKKNISIDKAFSSALQRTIHTLEIILKTMNLNMDFKKAWQLNERHYGSLQGQNKQKIKEKYGEELFQKWRRSFDQAPPPFKGQQVLSQAQLYYGLTAIPQTESLKDTQNRVLPFFEEEIEPFIKQGLSVLISAHGNSLRALIKKLEGLSDQEISLVEVKTGQPIIYSLDTKLEILNKDCP